MLRRVRAIAEEHLLETQFVTPGGCVNGTRGECKKGRRESKTIGVADNKKSNTIGRHRRGGTTTKMHLQKHAGKLTSVPKAMAIGAKVPLVVVGQQSSVV